MPFPLIHREPVSTLTLLLVVCGAWLAVSGVALAALGIASRAGDRDDCHDRIAEQALGPLVARAPGGPVRRVTPGATGPPGRPAAAATAGADELDALLARTLDADGVLAREALDTARFARRLARRLGLGAVGMRTVERAALRDALETVRSGATLGGEARFTRTADVPSPSSSIEAHIVAVCAAWREASPEATGEAAAAALQALRGAPGAYDTTVLAALEAEVARALA